MRQEASAESICDWQWRSGNPLRESIRRFSEKKGAFGKHWGAVVNPSRLSLSDIINLRFATTATIAVLPINYGTPPNDISTENKRSVRLWTENEPSNSNMSNPNRKRLAWVTSALFVSRYQATRNELVKIKWIFPLCLNVNPHTYIHTYILHSFEL